MSEPARPTRPSPDCVWDEENGVWIWPDKRDKRQREADENAAKIAENGDWEKHGFNKKHSARIDSR